MKKLLFIFLLVCSARGYTQCDTVTNINVTSIGYSSAYITFTATGTAYTYFVAVKDSITGATTYSVTSPSTVVFASGLSPNRRYLVYITSFCTSGSGTITADLTYNPRFTTKTNSIGYTPMTAAGYRFKYLVADSGLSLPFRDTALGRGTIRPGTVVVNSSDTNIYKWNGAIWIPVEGTGITLAQLQDTAAAIRGDFPDVTGVNYLTADLTQTADRYHNSKNNRIVHDSARAFIIRASAGSTSNTIDLTADGGGRNGGILFRTNDGVDNAEIDIDPEGVNITGEKNIIVSNDSLHLFGIVRLNRSAGKVLHLDTATNRVYYADGGSGTQGIDDVLAQNQSLTTNRSIDANGYNFEVLNANNIYLNVGGDNVFDASSTNTLIISGGETVINANADSLKLFKATHNNSPDTNHIKLATISNTGLLGTTYWPTGGGSGDNVYNTNGTLTGNRTIDAAGNSLTIGNSAGSELTVAGDQILLLADSVKITPPPIITDTTHNKVATISATGLLGTAHWPVGTGNDSAYVNATVSNDTITLHRDNGGTTQIVASVPVDSATLTLTLFYSSGSAYTIPTTTAGRVVLNVTNTASTQTITLPASPIASQAIEIYFDADVTTLSIAAPGGYTLSQAFTPTVVDAGEALKYSADITNTKYRRAY